MWLIWFKAYIERRTAGKVLRLWCGNGSEYKWWTAPNPIHSPREDTFRKAADRYTNNSSLDRFLRVWSHPSILCGPKSSSIRQWFLLRQEEERRPEYRILTDESMDQFFCHFLPIQLVFCLQNIAAYKKTWSQPGIDITLSAETMLNIRIWAWPNERHWETFIDREYGIFLP